MDGGSTVPEAGFLLLSYRVPAEPSRNRVAVWREIKKLGAVYLQDGVCLLPHDREAETAFRELADRIRTMNGEARLLTAAALDDQERVRLVHEFNLARDREYHEILEQCGHFQKEISRETKRENFSFAEVEEIEEDLDKLRRWYEKVVRRDRFGARSGSRAAAEIRRCEEALARFSQVVYEHENPVKPGEPAATDPED